jgi:hypothetical protein
MPMDTPEQVDAFKNVALQQGYDPKEVEGFIGMAKAASASKQAAAQAAQAAEMQQYEQKLRLQNQIEQQYKEKETPYSLESDPVYLRAVALKKLEGNGSTTGDLTEAEKVAISNKAARVVPGENGGWKVVPIDPKDPSSQPKDNLVLGYVDQLMNGTSKTITDIPAEDRGKVVDYLKTNNIDIYKVQKEREGSQVKNLISGLFSDYYGGDGQRGGMNDLSGKGLPGLGLSGLLTKGRTALGLGRGANYKATKDAMLSSLKALTGDKGVLTEGDAQRLGSLIPNPGDNPEYAARQWKAVNKMLSDKYGVGLPGFESEEQVAKPGLNDIGKQKNNTVGRFTIEVE